MLRTLQSTRFMQLTRGFKTSPRAFVAVGDSIPKITLFEGSPGNAVDLPSELNGKSIIVGIPGAFSPACSASHVPGFIERIDALKNAGVSNVYVVGVNDAFVMKAWGDSLGGGVKGIRFLADPAGEFNKELGLLFDAEKFFGNKRSKRYALVVEDGKVSSVFEEPDNVSVDVSAAAKVLESL
ncbi:uncharacterized protein KQ657_003669 [Scheffersomyces spartinae]|uniref:Thioredoxin domain-containing protein n=1 Tax=Scheffersomyces spartinae TaxID=45513 RepID=A0A9P8AJ66_9ASCO|nr:uncharacterized protein KQ657_003669 [Scheffersomyces spartinae]KAG7195148.1 hypothetical protein KQ657_003669 [Scheffersomyces spartinae]